MQVVILDIVPVYNSLISTRQGRLHYMNAVELFCCRQPFVAGLQFLNVCVPDDGQHACDHATFPHTAPKPMQADCKSQPVSAELLELSQKLINISCPSVIFHFESAVFTTCTVFVRSVNILQNGGAK